MPLRVSDAEFAVLEMVSTAELPMFLNKRVSECRGRAAVGTYLAASILSDWKDGKSVWKVIGDLKLGEDCKSELL